jgi:AcrR family transcriptional regulator
MTVDQIAAAVEMPRHTVYRHFRDELATGRAKRLLANAVRLDKYRKTVFLSHAKGSRRTPMHGQIRANGKALLCACGTRLAGLPDARSSRGCTGRQTE